MDLVQKKKGGGYFDSERTVFHEFGQSEEHDGGDDGEENHWILEQAEGGDWSKAPKKKKMLAI
jgi:hypothetical protein